MDAVRAIAMLLGIVLHAAIPYKFTPSSPWPVDNAVHSIYYNYLYLFIHSFRMQLFFVVAGFFARFLYLKIGRKAFIRHRFRRIVRPFIICLISIAPLSMLPFFYYQHALQYRQLTFSQNLKSVAHYIVQWNGMVHLWFLYYLIIFYIMMLMMQTLSTRLKVIYPIPALFKKLLIFPKAITLFILLIPVFLMTCLFQNLPLEPYTGFKPDLPLLTYYGFFFTIGYFVQSFYMNRLEVFTKKSVLYFIIGITLTPLVGQLDLLQSSYSSLGLFLTIRILFSIQTISLVFGFLGAFIKYLNTENYSLRYISDASYWMYLVHMPIVVWVEIWLIGSPVAPIFRFWIVTLAGIVVPLVTYALFVRYTFIGKALNGPRFKRNQQKKISMLPPVPLVSEGEAGS